jgi:hypothetical protein
MVIMLYDPHDRSVVFVAIPSGEIAVSQVASAIGNPGPEKNIMRGRKPKVT